MPISLGTLPAELWLEILLTLRAIENRLNLGEQGSDKTSLGNVSLACRTLHCLVEPYMFYRLRFSSRYDNEGNKTENLLGLFSERPEMRNWVHDLTIQTRSPDSLLGEVDPPENRISKTFCQLENIRRLQIDHMAISTEMWIHVHALSSLKELQLWNVTVSTEAGLSVDPDALRVRDLTIHEIRQADQTSVARCVLSPALERLHLSATIAPYVYKLPAPSGISRLRTLEVPEPNTVDDAASLIKFGAHHPSVRTLQFNRRAGEVHSVEELRSDVFPCLESFRGGINLARLMVRGRPVTDLEITGSRLSRFVLTKEALRQLSHGSVQLEHLNLGNVPWTDGCFEAIVDCFPALRTLRIWIKDLAPALRWIEESLTVQAARLQKLRSLRIYTSNDPTGLGFFLPSETRRRELRMLEELSRTNAPLRTVSFWGRSAWHRRTEDNRISEWVKDE